MTRVLENAQLYGLSLMPYVDEAHGVFPITVHDQEES